MTSVYSAQYYRETRERKRANRSSNLFADLGKRLASKIELKGKVTFPCTQYQDDIAGFAHDILGIKTWHKQDELFNNVQKAQKRIDGIDRVACRSSHKASKTFSFGVVALHRYCCFEDSLTVLGAPSERSIQKLVWREIRQLFAKSGTCYTCKQKGKRNGCEHSAKIPGECKELARTGLRGLGFAEVIGVVAQDPENFAGYSSPHLCYLLDESSGIKDAFFTVMTANMASSRDGFILAVSNPTKRVGWFFNAFHKQAESWRLVHISAFDCVGVDIPGLATQKYIDDARRDWGEESSNYKIRVLGEFDDEAGGGLFTPELFQQCFDRWSEHAALQPGMLAIGCDPAGATGENDATGFAVRRGLSYIHFSTEYGLEVDQIYNQLLELRTQFIQEPNEAIAVVIDGSGVGYDLQQLFRARKPSNIVLTSVRSSDKAIRKPQVFDRVREELVDNLRIFLRDGGSLPPGECEPLIEEANCFSMTPDKNNKLKATDKRIIKKILGRSPDTFDATALAAWVSSLPQKRTKARPPERSTRDRAISSRPITDQLKANMQRGMRPRSNI